MKSFTSPLLLCTFAGSLCAQLLPKGVTIWSKGMPPQGIEHKDNYGDHILSVSHREKNGVVELHEKKDDVMIVQSGEATLIVGGTGVNMRPSAPNEQHGDRIEGGVARHVSVGDVIHIPANTPHQFLLEPGTQITYTLVKIVNR